MNRRQHGHERAPWVIDTRELARRPGSSLIVERTEDAPQGLGTEVIAAPVGTPVTVQLNLESVVEGIWVSGSATTSASGACVRCLEPVDLEIEAPIQELFAYPDRAAHHREVAGDDSDEDDVRELDGDDLDLEPTLRDAVVLALPFKPLCRPDCGGLCSECGVRLDDHPGHQHDVLDPRWAALGGLSTDSDQTTGQQAGQQQERRN